MIAHNEPLEDKLAHISRILIEKANQYHDTELSQVNQDLDWIIMQHGIDKLEKNQSNNLDEYYRGYNDGYDDARESVINAL